MVQSNAIVGAIVAVVITGLLLGFVFPVGLDAINQDPTYEGVTIGEGEEVVIQDGLNATVTTSTAGTDATIQLIDTDTGDTSSQTINVGNSATYELESGSADVTVNSVTSGTPNTVNADYTVDKRYGWDEGSQRMFGVLGIFLVLVPLVAMSRYMKDA